MPVATPARIVYFSACVGKAASEVRVAAAACSGAHAQPLRPTSVIGPSNSGVEDGNNWALASDSTDRPAEMAMPEHKRSAAAIPTLVQMRLTRVNMLSIITESLKKT